MTMWLLRSRPSVIVLLLTLTASLAGGCARARCLPYVAGNQWPLPTSLTEPVTAATAASERDEIYMLAAMAVVYKDWQSDTGKSSRGYNIGSILVDPAGKAVAWGRNCNRRTGNGTQHGEVRLIQGHLASKRTYYLENHVVYTTLEPCAQCSGMMVLAKIGRVVYAQADSEFGKAMERLGLDSRSLSASRGYAPYPRTARSEHARTPFARDLDGRFTAQAAEANSRPLVEWLASLDAREIYRRAADRLRDMTPVFPENEAILSQTREFVATVPDHYTAIFPWDPAAPETAVPALAR